MRYPIETEKYIQAMRLEFGQNKAAEAAHQEIISIVNECYEDGLRGATGYPLDPENELRAFSVAFGKGVGSLRRNPILLPLIQWCNRAYAQGCEDAGRAMIIQEGVDRKVHQEVIL